MRKTFGALFFAVVAFLAMPALAIEIQSAGLNSSVFIDSHFEFTEVNVEFTGETQAPLILIENTITAVTLAQIRTMDSANDNITSEFLAFDSVTEKLPSSKFEVGWQSPNSYN